MRLDAYTRAVEVHSPEGVLVRTAVNLSVDLSRRRNREPFAPMGNASSRVIDDSPTPEEMLLSQQRLQIASEALSKLSPKARRILLAQRVYGMTYAEIAQREGLTVAAIEKQIGRSVHFLVQWAKLK